MSLYSGVTGKISTKIGEAAAKDLLHMSTWNVTLSKNMIEVTSFGDDYTENVPSIKKWTAKADGTTDFASASGQAELQQAFENGTLIEASFYLDNDTFFTGNCYITDLQIDHDAANASKISISIAGSGAPTLTVPTTSTTNGG